MAQNCQHNAQWRDTHGLKVRPSRTPAYNSSQGVTSSEHIDAMPSGTKAVNAFAAYVTESRHRRASYLVTSDGAERQEIVARRPLGDLRPITPQERMKELG